jgi:hypothetical protein
MKFTGLILILLLTAVMCDTAQAIPVSVSRRDAKFPTQQMVEKQTFTDPLASNSSTIKLSGYAGPTSAAAVTLSSFSSQPDMPRNLSITPGGTTGDVEACVITVNGTNAFGASISENFTFVADAIGKQTGNKAFKTVTSVVWPANCESGGFAATWSIGTEPKLGIQRCMANAGDFFFSTLAGAKEATAPTLAVNASAVESNTVQFNGTLNGANDFVLYYMQNYGCFP